MKITLNLPRVNEGDFSEGDVVYLLKPDPRVPISFRNSNLAYQGFRLEGTFDSTSRLGMEVSGGLGIEGEGTPRRSFIFRSKGDDFSKSHTFTLSWADWKVTDANWDGVDLK